MKKSLIFLTTILLLLIIPAYALASGSTDTKRIYIENSKVVVGSSIQIKSNVFGKVTSGKYSSSNTRIATVNSEGLITGIALGKVTISAEVCSKEEDIFGCTHTHTLNSELKIKVTSKGDYFVNDITLIEGRESKAEVTFPEGYTGSSKGTWTMEDSSIATITDNGLVKGLKVGSTTASYMIDEDDTGTTFNITVEELFQLSISQNQIYEGISQAVDLKYNDNYEGAHIGTWESSVPEKVSVDENGILSILNGDIDSPSFILITYTDSETSVSRRVLVWAWKTFKLSPEVLSLKKMESGAFHITFVSNYKGDKSGTWSIGDDSLATIDPNSGKVYGIKEGTTTVTFEHAASGLREEVSLKILPADEPTLTPSSTPTSEPAPMPSPGPSSTPTSSPDPSPEPSTMPSPEPSSMPSPDPSTIPSPDPSSMPTPDPSSMPSPDPSTIPSPDPSSMPSEPPTMPPVPS